MNKRLMTDYALFLQISDQLKMCQAHMSCQLLDLFEENDLSDEERKLFLMGLERTLQNSLLKLQSNPEFDPTSTDVEEYLRSAECQEYNQNQIKKMLNMLLLITQSIHSSRKQTDSIYIN